MFSAVRFTHYGKRPARAAKPRDTNGVLRTANYKSNMPMVQAILSAEAGMGLLSSNQVNTVQEK